MELVDLVPTLLEAAGEPVSKGMQGKSIWKVLTEGEEDYKFRDDIYCEHYNVNFKHGKKAGYATMIRTMDYKLIVYYGEPAGELYDIKNDPKETTNSWHDPDYQTTKMELYQALCDRMAETIDPLPERQAPW